MKIASYIDFEGEVFSAKALADSLEDICDAFPNALVSMKDNKLFFLMDNHEDQEKLF